MRPYELAEVPIFRSFGRRFVVDFETFIVTIQGRIIKWAFVPSEKRQGCTPQDYSDITEEERLYRKTKRRRKGLIEALYSLGTHPKWFATVVYDEPKARKISGAELKRDIDKLSVYIRRYYPKGWFIYSIEYSRKSGFHLHLLGRLGVKPGTSGELFERQLSLWWQRITGASEEKHTHVRFLKNKRVAEKRYGYLTKPSKINGHLKATILLEKKYNYGFINKANCPIQEKKRFVLRPEAFSKFRLALLSDHDASPVANPSGRHLERLMHAGAGLHIIQTEVSLAALNIMLPEWEG